MGHPTLQDLSVEVHHPEDVGAARRAAKQLAAAVGLEPHHCEEVALVASELASNLVRHAGGGRLLLSPLCVDERPGLQLESMDHGPGIADPHQALADGFSTGGSFGNGLGAVNRLMDEFAIDSQPGQGTHIVCRKWVSRPMPRVRPCPFDISVATRPKRGFDQNGDAFVVKHGASSTLVGVIDGLGHGEPAHLASLAARRFIESHHDQSLDALFRGTGYACRGTRGCVMALARFDWELETLTFASVGNIEARVIGAPAPLNFTVRRGIVGFNAPNARVTEHPWPAEALLVLYSDGLSSHWNWSDFPELVGRPAAAVAQGLLRRLGKAEDDATVLIVKQTVPAIP